MGSITRTLKYNKILLLFLRDKGKNGGKYMHVCHKSREKKS